MSRCMSSFVTTTTRPPKGWGPFPRSLQARWGNRSYSRESDTAQPELYRCLFCKSSRPAPTHSRKEHTNMKILVLGDVIYG